MSALIAVVALIVAVGACGRESAGPQAVREGADAAKFADEIRQRISTDAMMSHLQKLQDIADAHGGNRAAGEPGYDASVDYVAGALRDKGFDVQTPEFEVRVFKGENGTVTSGGASLVAMPLQFTIGTKPEGLTAPLVPARPGDAPGCAATDYDGLPVQGAVVLVDRGTCPFAQKMANAVARGAVGVIIANSVDEKEMGGTLGEDTDVLVPVVSVSKADGAALRAKPEQVTIKISAETREFKSRNVVAQTKTGATDNVVMVGAHLDSVPEGPGINDNGSGVAAVLETALQMGAEPDVRNAVRFGFWGAEELGLVGSANYIETLDVEELKDIALYLNFDMLASPNPGYFTYDGDQSAPRTRNDSAPRVPEGSAGIERLLVEYLASADKESQDTSFDGRSDYDAFTLAGIPSGGLFAGAEEKMSAEQAKLWDGKADEPFDPNYHKDTDTIEHIDRTALGIQGAGVGYVAAFYAQDQGGRNGMPDRADRTRHVVAPS